MVVSAWSDTDFSYSSETDQAGGAEIRRQGNLLRLVVSGFTFLHRVAKLLLSPGGARQEAAMSRTVAHFFIGTGQPGCLHDNQSGPYEVTTRRDLVATFRSELSYAGLPACLADQISWRRVWAQIKRVGASSVHVAAQGRRDSRVIELCGLTEAEYAERADSDC